MIKIIAVAMIFGLCGALPVAHAQNLRIVSGIVVDDAGAPVPGAGVVIAGTNSGTATGMDGRFTLNNVPSGATLEITALGFATVQEPVQGRSEIRIVLSEDTTYLDEVIVVGYGTTTRRSATGSVSAVRSEMIENRPVTNVTQALQGTAPNLIIQTRTFDPSNVDGNNPTTSLNIRGVSSTTNNDPLIVIDGVIADQSVMNDLNPMDIDNISILKDAGAAAIYGSRSASGVILITTKGGQKNERTKLRFSGSAGLNVPEFWFEPIDPVENARYRNLANTNAGLPPVYTEAEIAQLVEGDHRWPAEVITRNALQQSYTLSASGGGQKSSYMMSMGYYDQQNNLVGRDDYGQQRYTFRINTTTEIGRLKLTGILGYTRTNFVIPIRAVNDIIGDATSSAPYSTFRMKDDQGRYLYTDKWGNRNPLGTLEAEGYRKSMKNNVNANVSAEFKIVDGLKLRGLFGAIITDDNYMQMEATVPYYKPDGTFVRRGDNNYRNQHDNHNTSYLNSQLMLDFNKKFGEHRISAVAGITNEAYTATNNGITLRYIDPIIGNKTATTNLAGNTSGNTDITNGINRWDLFSYLGRVSYNYMEKYYAEVSARYDASSRFAKESRWGFFPSVSLGYRISEEPFMERWKENMGDLKLRGSWGILGNQAIGTYDRYTTYSNSSNGYVFNNVGVMTGGYTLGLEEDLTWEKTRSFNVGLDASIFRGTLDFAFDYFVKNTYDILMNPIVPGVFGSSSPKANIGSMRNQGWELSIKYHLMSGEFFHDFSFNLADSKNTVTSYPNHRYVGMFNGSQEAHFLIEEGLPFNNYYGWETDGLWQTEEEIADLSNARQPNIDIYPGDLRFKDQNGDGIIDDKDWVILGNAFPRYTFGFTYNVSWKGFDLGIFLQGVGKRYHFIRGELVEPFHGGFSHNIWKHQLDFWTPDNRDAKWPRVTYFEGPSAGNTNNYGKMSSLNVCDTKYLRLKNLTVGYTLPKKVSKAIGMERCRIYLDGQNLLTLSPTTFFDPEASEMSNVMGYRYSDSGRRYPSLIYYGFGIDVEF